MGKFDAFEIGGYRNGQRAMNISIALHGGPIKGIAAVGALLCEWVVIGRGSARCLHAEIDLVNTILAGLIGQEIAPTAITAHPGLYHPQHESCGDGGVHCVASRSQDVNPRLCGQVVLSCDHESLARNRWLADLPMGCFGDGLHSRDSVLMSADQLIRGRLCFRW